MRSSDINFPYLSDENDDKEVSKYSNIELSGHLVTPRIGYTHHGLYIGDRLVIERSREGINAVTLNNFSEGNKIFLHEHHERKYTRKQSVVRALSVVGENNYNVFLIIANILLHGV